MKLDAYRRELRGEVRRLVRDPVLLGIVGVVFLLLATFIVFPLIKVIQHSLWPKGAFEPKYFLDFFQKVYYWRPLVNSLIVGALV